MSESSTVWQGDWRKRVMSRIQAADCDTVSEYLAKAPTDSYVDAAARLGADVAALQLQWMQFGEANAPETIRVAAMDSLAREIYRYLPNGWNKNAKSDFDTARVYASWIGMIQEKEPNLRQRAQAVFDALDKLNPPVGWLPAGTHDPVLLHAFALGWPEEPKREGKKRARGRKGDGDEWH